MRTNVLTTLFVMIFFSILFTGCCKKPVHTTSLSTISVYTMSIEGKSFFKEYNSSDYMIFTFDTSSSPYKINCITVRGNLIKSLDLHTGKDTTIDAGNERFYLLMSKVSTKNIDKFYKKLKRENDIYFKSDSSNYDVNISVTGIGVKGGNKYAQIRVWSVPSSSKNSADASMLANPCPPCKNSYSK